MQKTRRRLVHEFVEFIPSEIEPGKLYISIPYATAVHKCCCGCGSEVVTPLSPTDWKLIFDGQTVSLSPSIGNWSFKCQSHYWIKCNSISWSGAWSEDEIRLNRESDREKKLHIGSSLSTEKSSSHQLSDDIARVQTQTYLRSILRKLWPF